MSVSRRRLFTLAVRAGASAAAIALLPREVLGGLQAGASGTHAKLIARSARPVDFETPVELLDSFITPTEAFFVRGHMTAPAVDAPAWQLNIDGDVRTPRALSVADLRALPAVSVTATLECAGNGRAFFDPPVAGVQWRKGAVGTSRWTGARLRDVVAAAGGAAAATHLWMSGGDRPLGAQPPFVRQVPWAKAMDADTIVAYEMDGQPIPLLHGAPLRVIVPGWEGAYSVKWLQRLTVASKEHDGFWVASAYRYPKSRVLPGAAVAAGDQAPLMGLAVKSLITRPLDGTAVPPGRVQIAGFAWAGESRIARVDVSTDGGATWSAARLTGPVHRFAWRRFEYDAVLRQTEVHTLLSRATDERGSTQPLVPRWNPSGYLWNAPDRIDISVGGAGQSTAATPVASHDTAASNATFERACRVCHDEDLSAQQRLTPDGWGREVDKMIRWGARVTPEERESLISFLYSRWGVR
ncbi:MAG TPA: molybdopterin-dependent oxidoreductase [Vicinamibacterales bacterium]|jgi:DMSO/TMAO reductase YedYZ molybdopterin-dependent catalytic subunit|nr:molybdopterin-dependent oxidoreductase [Vicinamibacterales bacterium]